MTQIRISKRAADEIEGAVRWWRRNRLAAPDLLEQEIAASLQLLQDQPQIGTRTTARRPGVRRLLLMKRRYQIFYTVDDGLVIPSLWHTSRRPDAGL